jgi:hypothetical protein
MCGADGKPSCQTLFDQVVYVVNGDIPSSCPRGFALRDYGGEKWQVSAELLSAGPQYHR